jgi:hypothetical protein
LAGGVRPRHGRDRSPPKADDVEAQLDELEQESDRIGEDISETRKDWEAKKADAAVPGAGGDPQAAEGGLPPEAEYQGKGEVPNDPDEA